MKNKKLLIFGYVWFISFFSVIAILFAYIGNSYSGIPKSLDTDSDASHPIIIIDAGHGGEDGGAIGVDGTLEKDLNLYIAQVLRDMLVSCGYSVVMTRNEDKMLYDPTSDYKGRKKALDLAQRVKIANSYENSIFISIHMNSFPQEQYSGLQVYYSKNSTLSKSLADSVQSLIHENIQTENGRKTKQAGSNIFVLDRISNPAILIECGFISNHKECADLSQNEYRQKLSLGIFSAITKYLDTPLDNSEQT